MDPADSCTPGIATTDGRLSARSLTGVGKPPRYGPTVPWAASARACSRVSGAFQYDGVAGRPHHGGEMPKTRGEEAAALTLLAAVPLANAPYLFRSSGAGALSLRRNRRGHRVLDRLH